MVTLRVHGIAAVSELGPHAVGKEFILRGIRPGRVAQGMLLMAAMHFLQEHQVCAGGTDRFTQLRQDEAAIEEGEPLVHVQREHVQAAHGGGLIGAARQSSHGFVHKATSGTTPGSVISSWSSDSFCSKRRAS